MAKRNVNQTVAVAVPASISDVYNIARTVRDANTFIVALDAANGSVTNPTHGIAHGRRNVGRFTGSRVVAFQNGALRANVNPDRQFTDMQLAWIGCVEFPAATGSIFEPTRTRTSAAIDVAVRIWSSVRAQFNRGGHDDPLGPPSSPIPEYRNDASGAVVATVRTPRTSTVVATPVAATVPPVVTPVAGSKLNKRGKR